MQPPDGPTYYSPPSCEEIFVAQLDKSIAFHQKNTNDPHNIGNAVICALHEVRSAYATAFKLPQLKNTTV